MATTAASLDERLAAVFGGDPTAAADPYAVFDDLREQAPVLRTGNRLLVSRYADAKAILAESGDRCDRGAVATGTTARAARAKLPPAEQEMFDDLLHFERLQMLKNEGPVHERRRRIAHRAFTPASTGALAETIQGYADEILDALAAEGDVCDLRVYAYQLPLRVMAGLLGVPAADVPEIHRWSEPIGRLKGATSTGAIDAEVVAEAHAGIRLFRDYVEEIAARHRGATPVSGLMAALIDAEEDDRLSGDELAAMFVVLLFAGHETTTNLIGNGMLELLRDRSEWERLCADPGLAPAAAEEMLRVTTPVQWAETCAVREFELDGVVAEPGDSVLAVLAAANRDPAVFAEPGRIDVTRAEARQHLSLGFGPHFCLGASLARLEGTIAFGTLARRFPRLELAGDDLGWRGGMLRGVTRLPVRLAR